MNRIPQAVVALCFVISAGLAHAQRPPASPQIPPTFEQVAGFEAGTRVARYDEVVAYLQAVARTSDRVRLRSYGQTPTGRKLWVVTVSSPANLQRLDTVEATLHRLAAGTLDEPAAAAETAKLPLVAWLGYGIHGDEVSATDGGLRLLERLVTGQDADTVKILDRVIVNVDPLVNPDGRDRDLAHIVAFDSKTTVLDRQNLVHHQFWPEGRTNHYLFDLNRDALYVTQPQSQQRVSAILAAMPQVTSDGHEMRWISDHLFAVPAAPLNAYLPPAVHASWTRFAADIGASYDAIGRSYYTRSWDEVVYPGYYDIMPAYHGATPLLFEQAGNQGVTLQLPSGRIRTYADTAENHYRSSVATLLSAADRKDALFASWYHTRHTAGATVAKGAPRAWIIPAKDSYKLGELRRVLDTQGVRYAELASPIDAGGLGSMERPQPHKESLPAGSLLIESNQPLAGIVLNMLEPQVPMDAPFLKAERERTDLGEPTQLYDITAWSLPLAYALPVLWTDHVPGGTWQAPQLPAPAAPPARASYGYAFVDPSLFATARLMQNGVRVRVATQAFARDGKDFRPGSLLIRNDDQSLDVLPLLQAEAGRSNVTFVPLTGALASDGPDLGEDSFILLTAPRVAIAGGPGTEPTSFGALWELFDERIGIPATLLDVNRLSSDDLSRYDTIIVADGDADAGSLLPTALKADADQLRSWMRSGGTLIVEGAGATAAARAGLGDWIVRSDALAAYPPLMLGRDADAAVTYGFDSAAGATGVESHSSYAYVPPVLGTAATSLIKQAERGYTMPARLPTLAEWAHDLPGGDPAKMKAAEALRRYLPHGAYLAVDMKPHSWLGFGAGTEMPALFRQEDALIATAPDEVVGRYAGPRQLVLAGLVWPEAVGYLAETGYLLRERVGSGQIIAFGDDPVFRGYSLGTQRLLLNAAILGPGMRSH